MVYTDGLQYSLWQSVYPLTYHGEKRNRKISLKKEDDIVTLMGEKERILFSFDGKF